MNIYEKLQSHVDMPEPDIYRELYHAVIEQDRVDYLGLIVQRAASYLPRIQRSFFKIKL